MHCHKFRSPTVNDYSFHWEYSAVSCNFFFFFATAPLQFIRPLAAADRSQYLTRGCPSPPPRCHCHGPSHRGVRCRVRAVTKRAGCVRAPVKPMFTGSCSPVGLVCAKPRGQSIWARGVCLFWFWVLLRQVRGQFSVAKWETGGGGAELTQTLARAGSPRRTEIEHKQLVASECERGSVGYMNWPPASAAPRVP